MKRVDEIKVLGVTISRKFSVAQHNNHLLVGYSVRSRCLHCALFDTLAYRQTLCIQFCSGHLRDGDSPRLTIAEKLFLVGRQLSVSVRSHFKRWALSVQRLTTNCLQRSHSTSLIIFIISCHPGATRTTR